MKITITAKRFAVLFVMLFLLQLSASFITLGLHGLLADKLHRDVPHTWIDDLKPSFTAYDARLNKYPNKHEWVPSVFGNTEDSEGRTVVDAITGDQVHVINKGWYEGGRIKYRIIRNARLELFEWHDGAGWEKMKRHGDIWIAEERWLEELKPIPSA